MKLAYRVFLLTLTLMALMLSVSAQTKRPDKDNRNIAPTVGTGGPVGGPTGLFTVYDGQTLRKGEFTFSAAYSNYDRDPGDVDITEAPISFQIGLSDHVELFFNTDAFRGVKVNSTRNVSSLYLPNATHGNAPAIVLAPNGLLGGAFNGQAVFRPAGNQGFVPYPFVGGGAGHFGYPAGGGIGQSGNPTLGVSAGGASNNFPGIGSTYGSILPGVVLTTVTLPAGPIGGPGNTAPGVFAVAPSYIPDAPLIGRPYGSSSFSTFTVGGKIRFTGPNNPIGVGIIPFYRFYYDSPDSVEGFSQLQRGSSPGSNRGDIGLIAFADARVRSWLNISANIGIINNGDIEAELPGGKATLLDRGDELLAAFALDFPVNKYFQPILEFRSLQYIGGRTPNAFENNPLDGLAGARVFLTRWAGVGAAYRYHFNGQTDGSFDDQSFSSNVVIPCTSPQPGGPACTPQVINQTFTGRPSGFRPSNNPHGFMLQGWIGRRNTRAKEVVDGVPTINSIDLSQSEITKPCAEGTRPKEGEDCSDDQTINVRTNATDPEGEVLTYNYTVSGGRVVGSGENVTWDLSGVNEGTYTITATVDDGCGVCAEPKTETVTVRACVCETVDCECGELSVTGPASSVRSGETMTFTASLTNADNVTFNWVVDKGEIISGQGTSSIRVSTEGLDDETVRATVNTTADCEACTKSESETGIVVGQAPPVLIDEFGNIKDNDVRARIDAFFIELQNNPGAQGYIINYGSSRQISGRERLIKNHMNLRGYDSSRIVFVNGGVESQIRTRLWLVPAGADASTIDE